MRILLARLGAAALISAALPIAGAVPAVAQPLPGTTCPLFSADNILNADVSGLPVNSQSATWKGNMAQNANLHPDLGTFAQWYGIPVNLAPPPTSGVTPTFTYNPESDHPTEAYPIDQSTFIEGGPGAPSGSDRHALVVNKNNCKLYEIFNLQNFTNGQQPQAGSGAVWDLSSNAMRPIGWTSADAAGLPITPLLLRPDEILAGTITHAIRFTAHCTHGYIWPGSHDAGLCATGFPPMGARFRLRGNFNMSAYAPNTQVVLKAFQRYGLILADNGADWYFGGTTDDWWGTTAGDQVVSELKTIPAAQFDAVDESSLQAAPNSYQVSTTIPCTKPALSAAPPSPQGTGSSVTFSAATTGCRNPVYRFWIQPPSGTWSIKQDYSTTNTFNWNSTGRSGAYGIEVDVRDSTSTVSYDAVTNLAYQLNACSAVSLGANPNSPQYPGTSVLLTGTATCPGTPTYRFWAQAPGGPWTIKQDYSTANTYSWPTTGLALGSYGLEVDVRNLGATDSYEKVNNLTYVLGAAPCSTPALGASPATPSATGATATFTTTTSGCANPRYRFWVQVPGGLWSIKQDYSPANTFTWTGTGLAGSYGIEVDVRDQSEMVSYDGVKNLTYQINGCSAAGLSARPPNTAPHGSTVTLTASSICPGTPTYKFWIKAPGGSWTVVHSYGIGNTFSWVTPATPGTYSLEVDVKDQGGTDTYEKVNNITYAVT